MSTSLPNIRSLQRSHITSGCIMNRVLIFLCLLQFSVAIWPPRNWPRPPRPRVSSRPGRDLGTEGVIALVLNTIDKATQGITTSELLNVTQQVIEVYDSQVEKVVPEEAVNQLIKEISEKIGVSSAIAALLEDNLGFDVKLLNDSLAILKALSLEWKQLKASGDSVDITYAAIRKIAVTIQDIIGDIIDVVKFTETSQNPSGKNTTEDLLLVSGVKDEAQETESVARSERGKRRVCLICIEWRGRICILCRLWG